MTNHRAFSAWKLPPHIEQCQLLEPDYLKEYASWIRDELDPLVAREGPDVLHADDVAILFKFFAQLRISQLTLDSIRDSRIHFALLDIIGRGTRWPSKLIDEAEDITCSWELIWGRLRDIKVNLYGPGGRLYRICTPEDIQKELLFVKWARREIPRAIPNIARRTGDLGFKPGDWWINPMFAFYDGIIDHGESEGRITACSQEAYALLLTNQDELESTDPEHFTYQAPPTDTGRYRLTAGTLSSRHPIRVLRSHTLRSFWSPRAGVRYDGLYKVSGWRITQDPKTKAVQYNISFARLPSEPPFASVLNHPTAAEFDDYQEYKRIRTDIRRHRNLLRHGLQFGPSDRTSLDKTESNDTTVTVKRLPAQGKPISLSPQRGITEPLSNTGGSPDDNPFFSGALDSQSGLGKINTLRPDVINYAPVLNAASAAGASVDPFFAGALEEQAAKRAAATRPRAPTGERKTGSSEKRRPSVIAFVEHHTEPASGKKRPAELDRRKSSGWQCPLRRCSRGEKSTP